ncbi:MAG: hypothetical protein KKB50_22115 [Planctomycetes bacterium]|nr:hypothetical protein [Planctomycetota bacterium]
MTISAPIPPGKRVWRVGRRGVAIMVLLATATTTQAQSDLVTISGGVDATGHQYVWTVTNKHDSPLVFIHFPQSHADTFIAPAGWTASRNPPQARKGPPVGLAEAPSPKLGIQPGQSVQFTMRINAAGARRGFASVPVRFADGTEALVGGVAVPESPSKYEHFMVPVVFAVILVITVAIQLRRRRKSEAAAEPQTPPESAE